MNAALMVTVPIGMGLLGAAAGGYLLWCLGVVVAHQVARLVSKRMLSAGCAATVSV